MNLVKSPSRTLRAVFCSIIRRSDRNRILQPTLLGERLNLSNLYFPFEETGMSAVAELGRKRFLKTLHEISFLNSASALRKSRFIKYLCSWYGDCGCSVR